MAFRFLVQMLRAPPRTFPAELLVELKSDSRVNQHAWLFGALKIISKGLSFPRRDCLLERVESMLDRLRVEPTALLFQIFTENIKQSMYRTARENWLHARTAHTASLEISNAGLLRMETFHLVFPCRPCIIRCKIFAIWFFSC